MTTETDHARPRNLGRIDPALRDAAAGLDIAEFRFESLPADTDHPECVELAREAD
jgi:acetyl esterase